jgi:hypothetical protein
MELERRMFKKKEKVGRMDIMASCREQIVEDFRRIMKTLHSDDEE